MKYNILIIVGIVLAGGVYLLRSERDSDIREELVLHVQDTCKYHADSAQVCTGACGLMIHHG